MNVIYIDDIDIHNESCLWANDVNDSWLWNRRLGHASMKTLSKLVINDHAIGFPKYIFNKDKKYVMHVNLVNKWEVLLNQRT